MKFGDYCLIEQKRYRGANEMYQHKVIGTLRSNTYVDVPVQTPPVENIHPEVVNVVNAICCGVEERQAFRYRVEDVKKEE